MPTKFHTVTINGQTFTRESENRTYTHAIAITCTEAERAERVGKTAATVGALEDMIGAAAARIGNFGEAEAFAAATARVAYLEEPVTEQLRSLGEDEKPLERDGQPIMHTCERWLSHSYIAAQGSGLPAAMPIWQHHNARRNVAMSHIRTAREVLLATAQGALDHARAELVRARAQLAATEARYVVGSVVCENWSQSARGAAKLAADAQKARPLAQVAIVTDITVRAAQPRAKKPAV